MQLPSFLVVGPPRTGTSWLHKLLEPHTNLPSPTKETRFFDLHFHRGLGWYSRRFPHRSNLPVGEIAPTYFASAEARRNIASTIPCAKIIFIFRNPVQRAVSLYRMKCAYGRIPSDFEEALRTDPELISSGLYWTQLSEWRMLFPERQLLITTYDDLVNAPQGFVDVVADFIGIPRFRLSPSQANRVYSSEDMTQPRSYLTTRAATIFADWCKSRGLDQVVASVRTSVFIKLFLGGGKPIPDISPSQLHKLSEIFRPEIECLENVLGRGLEDWKLQASVLHE